MANRKPNTATNGGQRLRRTGHVTSSPAPAPRTINAAMGLGKPQGSFSPAAADTQRPARKRTSESIQDAARPSFPHGAGRGAPDFRALTVFESLPAQHKTFRVGDDGSDPHLHEGEYAVIDTTDRELQHGELYVIQYEDGRRSRHISQATTERMNTTGEGAEPSLVWFMRDLRGFRKTNESIGGIPVFAGLSDGPYWTEHLQSKLIGRVVGVASSPLGELLAPAAGWENEAAGNAAFDPAEYIDALLAADYKPYVFPSVKHGWDYCEHFPERRLKDAEEAAVMAARYKFCAASTALVRVIEECRRRGMTV